MLVDRDEGKQHLDLCFKYVVMCRLVDWLQQSLGPRVSGVRVSSRLVTFPAVLVQGEMGLSPTMVRYMQQQAAAQGVTDQTLFGSSMSQPILEINPDHPIVEQLDMMVCADTGVA